MTENSNISSDMVWEREVERCFELTKFQLRSSKSQVPTSLGTLLRMKIGSEVKDSRRMAPMGPMEIPSLPEEIGTTYDIEGTIFELFIKRENIDLNSAFCPKVDLSENPPQRADISQTECSAIAGAVKHV